MQANAQHSPTAPRLDGLDALRGIASVLVIALHAAISYLVLPMPGLVWPARDNTPSPTVDAIFWAIEGFIMPLFFLLSGYFAWGLCRQLGARAFLGHRVRRVLGPLAFGCVAILPVDFYTWVLGFVADGRCTWRPLRTMKFPPDIARNLWGLSHLWYLQYLFLCSTALVATVWIAGRIRARRLAPSNADAGELRIAAAVSRSSFRNALLPLGLGALGGTILFWEPNIVAGFQHGFLPALPKFVYSLLYFAAGVWLAQRPERVEATRQFGVVWLVAAVPLLFGAIPLIHRQQLASLPALERTGLAGLTALFAATTTLGLFGVFLQHWTSKRPVWKYLAEASFWIYLAHHPLVGLLQIDSSLTAAPPVLEFAAILGIALTLTLASYEVLVRRTWVGALLNGRRKLRPEPGGQPAAPPQESQRRAA